MKIGILSFLLFITIPHQNAEAQSASGNDPFPTHPLRSLVSWAIMDTYTFVGYPRWNKKFEPVRSTKVPFIVGMPYGWHISMTELHTPIRVREEVRIPAPAAKWPSGAGVTVSADKKSAIILQTMTPDKGYLRSVWTIAEGDPLGRYEILVTLDESVTEKFYLEVVDVPEEFKSLKFSW